MESESASRPEPLAYVLGLIRAGTYPWIAARAAAISDDKFRQIISDPSPLHTEVLQAQAQARAKAEIDLKDKNPLAWLRYGPGRPSRDGAGWTAPAKAAWDSAADTEAIAGDMVQTLARIREFGEANPDVRVRLAELLSNED